MLKTVFVISIKLKRLKPCTDLTDRSVNDYGANKKMGNACTSSDEEAGRPKTALPAGPTMKALAWNAYVRESIRRVGDAAQPLPEV